MRGSVRTVEFGDTSIPILASGHLLVCKAAFDRPKDWIDIEQILVGSDLIDENETARWLISLLGAEDERVARLRDLWKKYR